MIVFTVRDGLRRVQWNPSIVDMHLGDLVKCPV